MRKRVYKTKGRKTPLRQGVYYVKHGKALKIPKTWLKKYKGHWGLKGIKNLNLDRKRKARPPGIRRSKSGKTYYEYRANRSDGFFRPGWYI